MSSFTGGIISGSRSIDSYESMLLMIDAHVEKTLKMEDQRIREEVQKFRGVPLSFSESRPTIAWLFALIREASVRVLGKNPYRVQILAGLCLADGNVAEVATGEGKTLIGAFPAAFFALQDKGVHVCTVNSYLAGRDCEILSPLLNYLGFSVGHLKDAALRTEKKKAYDCDITYGTGYEYGFDYLRDQLVLLERMKPGPGVALRNQLMNKPDATPFLVQRGHQAVIIDEIDSVLIDEGLMPLIISNSGNGPHPAPLPFQIARDYVLKLDEEHYDWNRKNHHITLTQSGHDFIYQDRSIHPTTGMVRPWHTYIDLALQARYLMNRDVHYVVIDEAIQLVDQNTGRLFKDRKWRDGLHQSVEAKERITITQETSSEVAISRSEFYKLYSHFCGMTGTAKENKREFRVVYKKSVVTVPLNRPSQRKELEDAIFMTPELKLKALIRAVVGRAGTGQPILIGTRTIASSEEVATLLERSGVYFRLLNAKQDKEEAEIVSMAGLRGSITIATNMAGRGTDIPLGTGVAELGGLHVIGVERQESRRVDRQLIGRAARQGDPGSGQFFVSAEDELIVRYNPALSQKWGGLKPAEDGRLPEGCAGDVKDLQDHLEEFFGRMRLESSSRERWLDKLRDSI
ncbi:MAG: hypothetical protein SGI71_07080 [Verrucomicrobiota bacterium]|nr:hypothetical protein [Verrucomicrobiota bacterium]